jgi:hypothetical protein
MNGRHLQVEVAVSNGQAPEQGRKYEIYENAKWKTKNAKNI